MTTVSYGDDQSITVDAVLLAVGRRPLTDGLLADGTGVTVDGRGFVIVDQLLRTTADGGWAVGDVVDTPQLAHVGFTPWAGTAGLTSSTTSTASTAS
jgi:dihydrolipoamide dehydrogenase